MTAVLARLAVLPSASGLAGAALLTARATRARLAWLSLRAARATDRLAGVATAAGWASHRFLPEVLHLPRERITGHVGVCEGAAEVLDSEDDPGHNRPEQQCTGKGDGVTAAPPPFLSSEL
ncbi:hypothetical protein [Streptomyces decoyicus]|uniref:hypothetical protein n=1 Tax=Streptomyces decoyicus TaxID=249567 RepID=UPI0033B08E9D